MIFAGIDRSALGHDPDQDELLERAKHRQVDGSANGAAKQGQGDVQEILEAICAIDAGSFFDLHGDVLQTRQIQQHVKAKVFPGQGGKDGKQDRVCIAQPGLGSHPRNQDQERVEKAAIRVGVEKQQPHDGGDDFGKHVRHEKDGAEKCPSGQVASHHDRQRQGQGQLNDQREAQ